MGLTAQGDHGTSETPRTLLKVAVWFTESPFYEPDLLSAGQGHLGMYWYLP